MSSAKNYRRGATDAQLTEDEMTEEEFAARISSTEPRMSALSDSNEILRNSMPVAPPWSLGRWIDQHTGGSLRKAANLQFAALDWLEARAPWQRVSLSIGLGAVIGLGIVFSSGRFVRGGQDTGASPQAAAALPTAEVVAAVRPSAVAPPPAAPMLAVPAVEASAAKEAADVGAAAVDEEEADEQEASDEPSEDVASDKADQAQKAKAKKRWKRRRARHRKEQEANPLKEAAAQAAARLAQPRAHRSTRSKRASN